MPLIDDDGSLFGLVNVVDALVALFVVALVIGGSAFVLADDSEPVPTTDEPETETRYATLDLGDQPKYVAELLSEGDATVSESGNLTVTDVYAVPTQTSDRRVFVRVELTGEPSDETIQYDGDIPRVGRQLTIETDDYRTDGTITTVDETDSNLPTENESMLLRATVPTETAEAIEPGDEYDVDGRTVGTVESVTAYGTDDPDRKRVYVGVTYRALRLNGDLHVGDTRLHENVALSFETDAYDFNGTVARVGTTEQSGEPATRTVQLEIENVDPDLADSLDTDMAERVRGETVAELTRVDVEPSTVVLTSEDGQIYQRDHPVEKDVSMTAQLSVRETPAGLTFKGERLQQGDEVVLDLGTVTVRATVVRIE
ncbi:DUF4330 family protein [Haloprofundus halobius]|uniref:DUF4330 family protein n=1 Tax=Haloprofundus halobius TaxID=2876194 RepID=UPI001CCBFBC8|nr:DUF4330 family protein [Haloprofundus halobius]